MKNTLGRRQFLSRTSLTAGGLWLGGLGSAFSQGSPNGRLNVGVIGVANRAGEDLKAVAAVTGSVNIVALCDIDANYLAAAKLLHPGAKTFGDWRKLLDEKGIDAVIVGTPDHNHAVATVAALRSGRHVYCEKPLTHTISEARIVAETAKRERRVTQMGNQIHASNNYRRVVELLQSGAIGVVREIHVWVDSVWEPMGRPAGGPVPPHINYEMWLGPVTERPYSPEYVPFKWRRFWHFGGGTLADFCCHHIDLSHWAFNLRTPVSAEAVGGSPVHAECAPRELSVRYEYAARDAQPAINLTWYHGGLRPPHFAEGKLPKWGNGSLFVGDRGMLLADYGRHVLLPEKDFAGFTPPAPSIPDSIGHHKEWVEACRNGGPTTCNFEYGAALTETGLLGNVAHRVGRKIVWDTAKLRAVNCPEADQYLQHHYRPGWKI